MTNNPQVINAFAFQKESLQKQPTFKDRSKTEKSPVLLDFLSVDLCKMS
jgi:hypothetical protein